MSEFITSLMWYDWVGIVGSLLLCLAYLAVSNKWLASDEAPFQWINLIGAGLLLLSLCFRPNYGAILIEIIWALIAVISLVRIMRREGAALSEP